MLKKFKRRATLIKIVTFFTTLVKDLDMKNIVLTLILLLACLNCSGYSSLKITKETIRISERSGFSSQIYQTDNFDIFTLQKITDPSKNLRIYIEGDGHAFITSSIISPDPTPRSYFLINLISQDNYPNILYIARPCQYVMSKKCEQKYWTNARFSAEVVDSITQILENFKNFKLELVGYSGGGAIALYIASKNEHIVNLRTIAGNIDHEKFTEIHHTLPLDLSLSNQEKNFTKLANLPQIHFIGKKDSIVPEIIAKSYIEELPIKNCVQIIELPEADHNKNWKENWPTLLKFIPGCQKNRANPVFSL